MTRQEIRAQLQTNGTLEVTKSLDPLWKVAFDLYNKENKANMKISCGGCWSTVRAWLKRN